jgi:hypothetical protein
MKKLFLFVALFAYVLIAAAQTTPPAKQLSVFSNLMSPIAGSPVLTGPQISLSVDSMFFGDVRSGATTRQFIEIENTGDETLVVTEISLTNNIYFYTEPRDSLPISIEPQELKKVGIWFYPESETNYTSTISIFSNDAQQSLLSIPVTGLGFFKEWQIGEVLWLFNVEGVNDPGPKAISGIQDVTGDEIEDVIVCSEDHFVRCFNGNADGIGDLIWEYEILLGTVFLQNAIARIPDIDDDGYEDIIVGTGGDNKSVIALSGYSGQQIWKHQTTEFGDGGNIFQVDTKYDYNGDGLQDVLAAAGNDNENTGPKRVYCLDGKNGDSVWTCALDGPVFSVIGIEDFTGDGKPDVLAGTSNETETEGSFYAIDGETGDDKWHFVTQASSVWALGQIDDINENGTKDIIAGLDNGQYFMVDPKTLFILKTSSIGSFKINRFVVIDDISRDFYKDVLVAHDDKRAIVIDGANAGYWINEPIDDQSLAVDRIADISGDEQNDIIIGSSSGSNFVYFIETYTNEIIFEDNYETPVDAIKSINDINNDLSMEIVAGGRNGKITCYSGGLDATVGISQHQIRQTSNLKHNSFPNPFTNETNLIVDMEQDDHIIIKIFDSRGRFVKEIQNGQLPAGRHNFKWNPAHSNSKGIYFYNITSSTAVVAGKLVLIR